MARRIPTWLRGTILLGALVLVLTLGRWVYNRPRSHAEAETFALLAHARSPAELRDAVGPLGAVIDVRGGGWVAIRYSDSHAIPWWSSAVARDSGGGWFVSPRHFCARFSAYRMGRQRGWPLRAADDLLAVEEAGSLEAAR
jgi:hypothetical protein